MIPGGYLLADIVFGLLGASMNWKAFPGHLDPLRESFWPRGFSSRDILNSEYR